MSYHDSLRNIMDSAQTLQAAAIDFRADEFPKETLALLTRLAGVAIDSALLIQLKVDEANGSR